MPAENFAVALAKMLFSDDYLTRHVFEPHGQLKVGIAAPTEDVLKLKSGLILKFLCYNNNNCFYLLL
jgi:hypothetical protein